MTATLSRGNLGGLRTRKASDDNSLPSLFLYGGNGAGKSTLAASSSVVPEMSPAVVLNIENGTQSLKAVYPDIEVVDVDTFGELQSVYDDLYKQRDKNAQTAAGYKTVILDNATESQAKGVEHIFNKDNKGMSFAEFSSATYANGGWNTSSEQMRKMVRAFRDLPCYVIVVAWEMDLSKQENSHLWAPAFTRTVAGQLPGLLNDAYRLYLNRENQRVLQTGRTNNTVAKDRTQKLPFEIVNPTFQTIFDYWSGKKVRTADEAGPKKTGLLAKKS